VGVFERKILMLKCENCSYCVGFSWLRMKSTVSHCEVYKLLIPLKKGSAATCVSKKDRTLNVFS
jgi:hypothetical protein